MLLGSGFNLMEMVFRIPALLLALSFHELAHGFVAYKLGDLTAKNDGRLTLNPFRHLDPMGVICMILFRFGFAKPVMVDSRYFKNPKKGMALTAMAGPLANYLLAFISIFFMTILYRFSSGSILSIVLYNFFMEMVLLNLSLGTFNLLPIPPLDGSKVFSVFLNDYSYFRFIGNQNFTLTIILMVLIFTGGVSYILTPIIYSLYNGMSTVVNGILFFI